MRSWLAVFMALVLLGGCAGTVQRETGSLNGSAQLVGVSYRKVEISLTDSARKLQADNPQFNTQELAGYVQRHMDSYGLLQSNAAYTVNVTIEEFRVRSALSAVMLGVLAGTDSINGRVQVLDGQGRQLHTFRVNATYGLGGWAGGQDGMRMNWMYDKFAELTLNELMGTTAPNAINKARAPRIADSPIVLSPDTVAGSASTTVSVVRTSAASSSRPAYTASGFANIDDIDAIPFLADDGRQRYREWLTKSTPRAFAISDTGHFAYANGLKSTDESSPKDPSERALLVCARINQAPCKLYAVNGAVVWVKSPEPTYLSTTAAVLPATP